MNGFSDLLWMAALIPGTILVVGCLALLLDRRRPEASERERGQ